MDDEPQRTAVLERLLDQAHLFDDPVAYEAGVRDAIEALEVAATHDEDPRVARSKRAHPSSAARLRAVRHPAA